MLPRHRSRRRLRAAYPGVLAALLLLWPSLGRAGPSIAGAPRVVAAGSLVEVRWTPPAGARELELLLVLDGSAGEPLRLTGNLPATSGTWLWRVPHLPAASARLLLRWGDGDREVEGEPGPAFTIRSSPGSLAAVTRRDGELWLGPCPAPRVRAGGLAPAARASWPSGAAGAATLPREPLPPVRCQPAGPGDPVGAVAATVRPATAVRPADRSLPQRE